MRRRTWLLSAAAAGGALVVGWGVLPARSRLGAPHLLPTAATEVALNGWLKVRGDGQVVLAMARSEMGQGVHTALPMLVAEELDLALDQVLLEQAGADAIYGNVAMFVASLPFHPAQTEEGHRSTSVKVAQWMVGKLARELGINATGGSSSVADAWDVLRMAAATARASLLAAAAAQWSVPVQELRVRTGVVSHPSGRTAHYGQLAAAAVALPPGAVSLKPRDQWRVLGQAWPRKDLPSKVNGSAVFGIDVRPPGLLYAALRMSPMLGGSPARLEPDAALRMAGVQRLVRLPSYAGSSAGFAVVGSSYWSAQQAVQAVQVDWQQRPTGALDSQRIRAQLEARLARDDGFVFHESGDVQKLFAQANPAAGTPALVRVAASYHAPYLAHATMEPMNCTAQVSQAQVTIWVPTQVPQLARAIAAKVAGVAVDDVSVHVTSLGGGFGRRLEVDFVAQAVRVAMDCGGRPVQLIWSREQDMGHDFYRPMHSAYLEAALDSQGVLQAVRIRSAGDAITPRWMERTLPALAGPVDTPDKTTAEGLFDLPYAIPHQRMSHAATHHGVPVGFWRSVGHSHNAFFSESFIDELALLAGKDPLAYRRQLLAQAPRHLAVLERAAEKSQWAGPLPAGRARGVALHESFGSIVALVLEVSLGPDRTPRVHQATCALDCGTVVNPGIVAQQVESAVLFGLSAALYGRIDIRDGVVQQSGFGDYPLVGLAQAPQVQTWLLQSDAAPTGVGEPAVPPVAPALANALFRLTGVRRRELPLMPA